MYARLKCLHKFVKYHCDNDSKVHVVNKDFGPGILVYERAVVFLLAIIKCSLHVCACHVKVKKVMVLVYSLIFTPNAYSSDFTFEPCSSGIFVPFITFSTHGLPITQSFKQCQHRSQVPICALG